VPTTSFKRWKIDAADIAVLLVLAAVSLSVVSYGRNAIPDDAFIYLRIVDNLVAGQGWSFNAGHPISAATSPLYVLVLAALHLFGINGPQALLAGFALGLFLLAGSLYVGLRQQGRAAAALIAFVVLTWPALLRTIGLETSVFLGCVSATCLAYQARRLWTAGLLAGLTCLARPDGIAIVVLATAFELWKSRRVCWSVILPATAIVSAWLAFSMFEFGSIVPHTVLVKALQRHIGWWNDSWFRAFLRQLPCVFPLTHWPWAISLIPIGIAALVGLFTPFSQAEVQPFLPLVILFGIVQVGVYSWAAPVEYPWYYAPGDLAVAVSASVGVLVVCRRLWRVVTSDRRVSGGPWATDRKLVPLIALAYALAAFAAAPCRNLAKPYRLSDDYIAIARWANANGRAGDWIACDEIGYIGYYSKLNVRDMLGLLDADSLRPLSELQWAWWFVEFAPPRFIVVHAGTDSAPDGWIGEPGSRRFPWPRAAVASFRRQYQETYRSGPVVLFERLSDVGTIPISRTP